MQPQEPSGPNSLGVGGADAFALPLDNLLELKARQVRAYLALMALVYRSAIISDSWAFTNAGLIEMLLATPDGQEFLTQGLLRVALRDSRESFGEVLTEFRAANNGAGMHGLIGDESYATFLDVHASRHRIAFPRTRVGANYVRMMGIVLSEDFLIKVGVSPEAAEIAMRIITAAKADKSYVDSNTFIKDRVQPHIPGESDKQLVMDTARAPYSLNLPTLLGTGVQGPDDYTGDRVLQLMGDTRATGTVTVTSSAPTVSDAFSAVVGDATVRWLFSPDILASLTAEDIVAARTTHESDRLAYITALETFLAKPSDVAWMSLVGHMQVYFGKAALAVLDRWAASGRLASDHIGTPVKVDATGASLKILLDKPLQVSGVGTDASPSEVPGSIDIPVPEAVKLVGRTLTVPSVGEAQLGA